MIFSIENNVTDESFLAFLQEEPLMTVYSIPMVNDNRNQGEAYFCILNGKHPGGIQCILQG